MLHLIYLDTKNKQFISNFIPKLFNFRSLNKILYIDGFNYAIIISIINIIFCTKRLESGPSSMMECYYIHFNTIVLSLENSFLGYSHVQIRCAS